MKVLTLLIGFSVVVLGVGGIVAPGSLVTLGLRSVTPIGLYVVAAFRVLIGLVLLGASSQSRIPRTLRVFGIVALVAGLTTPLLGVERANAIVTWLAASAPVVVRLWGLVAASIGGVIIYAATGRRRSA